MKKIITLLFFAGFLTSGFAQSRHGQDGYQNNGNSNQSPGYSRSYPGHDGWNNDRDYAYNRNRDNEREHGYDREHGYEREHGYDSGPDNWNRRDDRDVKRRHNHYDGYDNGRGREYAPKTGGSLLQIILSGTIRF